MRLFNLFSPAGFSADAAAPPDPEVRVVLRRPLQRVLAFTGRSIDDVINDPIARNEVRGYYKLHKQVERSMEVTELERQWNPLGRRG